MYLVVDPNVVISAIITKGNASNVFSLNSINKKFNFIAPNFLFIELGKHTERIMRETHFSEEILNEEVEFVMSQITFILEEEFSNYTEKAREILKGHEKDVPYLALALAFNCRIFSGDKELKSIIPNIVITPRELLEEF